MQTRNTVQRQIVLQAVLRMHDHPTADTVYAAVAAEHPSISKATVYRNLISIPRSITMSAAAAAARCSMCICHISIT